MPTNNTPEMTLEEGNRLIADFDELMKPDETDCKKESWYRKDFSWVHISKLQYHSSWDWIMPVAEKIVKMTPIKGIVIQFTNMKEVVVDALMRADKEKIWASCVHFTQWYNTQTLKP